MKAYYFENNGFNGILLTSGDKWISYDEQIDGIEINRDNISQIVKNLSDYGYDDNDFNSAYEQECGTLVYGEGVNDALDEQDYTEEIYSA